MLLAPDVSLGLSVKLPALDNFASNLEMEQDEDLCRSLLLLDFCLFKMGISSVELNDDAMEVLENVRLRDGAKELAEEDDVNKVFNDFALVNLFS